MQLNKGSAPTARHLGKDEVLPSLRPYGTSTAILEMYGGKDNFVFMHQKKGGGDI